MQHLNLLTRLGKMKKSLRRLSSNEFDAALLERLTKEGRVFVDFPRTINKDAYVREVLDYVHSIKDYATDLWQEEIDDLWQEILDDECLSEFLTMKKGMQAGHMNRYAVTNLVCRMQNNGIYRRDVPMLTLHLRMEGVKKKNRYYTNCGNYVLPRNAKVLLRQLFERV